MEFILNNQTIATDKPGGMTLLDFIRYERGLVGSKIGCREGDCGACTVLVGEKKDGKIRYRSITSCISPLANAAGKHVVTIEGLNMNNLSPVQKAMAEANGTQCGFCTVGFVVSLSGYCMEESPASKKGAVASIDGNICRCTGYKSIERAADAITDQLKNKDAQDPIAWLVMKGFIPEYFLSIPERLSKLDVETPKPREGILVGGGTDLYVQRHEDIMDNEVHNAATARLSDRITLSGNRCSVGASASVTDMLESPVFRDHFPEMEKYVRLISSTPIRNMGTVAGNLVNASPIGDLSIFFLALNSEVNLENQTGDRRSMPMRQLYNGYKLLDLREGEHVTDIQFNLVPDSQFNFEKVSKRTNLDIASVNSAIRIRTDDTRIIDVAISAGGVSPIPLFLEKTSSYLKGKSITPGVLAAAVEIMNTEIAPISDVRGSKEYKALLLRQLFFAHFIVLFPQSINLRKLA